MSKKTEAFALFDQGLKPSDQAVKNLKLADKTRYNYYQEWKKLSLMTGADNEGKSPASMTKIKPATMALTKETDAVCEAAWIRLVPQTLTLPLTPDIYISYMCALKNGYEGNLADWLGLVSLDFWAGRGRDMFAEVSGINPSQEAPKNDAAKG